MNERGSSAGVVPPHLPGHRFVELIDSGGFAEVFRYRRELLDWDVAVKVLRSGLHSGLPGQDFINEARIMAELAWHPNIMTIHDHGTVADGRPYLVMDYCAPPNLKERSRDGKMPVQEVLEVGILIAGAVETAHRAGYLHRDIKPANILVNAGGEPVLADFGISSAILVPETERDALSLPWAALEVVRGERAGPTADVHSLGATIYTLLAGRAPFHREGASNSWYEMLLRLQGDGPEPIGRPDLPRGLEYLLRRSMSADAALRPSSALQFAHQLAAFGPPAWRAPEPKLGRHSTPMIRQFTAEDVGEVPDDVGGLPGGDPEKTLGRGESLDAAAGLGGSSATTEHLGPRGSSVDEQGFGGGTGSNGAAGATVPEEEGRYGPSGWPGSDAGGSDVRSPGGREGGSEGSGGRRSDARWSGGSEGGFGSSGGAGSHGRWSGGSGGRGGVAGAPGGRWAAAGGVGGPAAEASGYGGRQKFGVGESSSENSTRSWDYGFPGDADTLVRSSGRGGPRSKALRALVVGAALAAAIAAVWIFKPWSTHDAPCQDPDDLDPSCAAESVEEPGIPGSAIDPGRPDPPTSLGWERKAGDAVLSWEVKDAQAGDLYLWWVEGEGLDRGPQDTVATSVTVPGAGKKDVCAVVSVSRQGRASEENRKCFEVNR